MRNCAPSFPRFVRRKSAFALLFVLGSLVFISVLAVGVMLTANSELRASRHYADGASARLLADLPVSIVMGQISLATKSASTAWVSQPGMIRTYGTSSTGSFSQDPYMDRAYKLYSWDKMVQTRSESASALSEPIPGNWQSQQGAYVDLNKALPYQVGAVTYSVFPIIDGNDLTTAYPGYPSAETPLYYGPTKVKGFSVSTASISGYVANQSLPMPVKWIYVLRNGTLFAPSATDITADGVQNITGATADNPVIGRIAFWTDDETCKVNINTAVGDEWGVTTGGINPAETDHTNLKNEAYWDTPHANTLQDRQLAISPPNRTEYVRQNGHPASVYLSAVFPALKRSQLFSLFPRTKDGGTVGGSASTVAGSQSPIAHPAYPFYNSVDELLYPPSLSTAATRVTGNLNNDIATRNDLYLPRAKFFLTTASRAPEVNIFNQPRISLWPLSNSVAQQSDFDKRAVLASTLGSGLYALTPNAASDTQLSQDASFNSQRMFDYMTAQVSRTAPGFGASLQSKYSGPMPTILLSIVDYLRVVRFTAMANSPGQVSPTIDASLNTGMGRFFRPAECGFVGFPTEVNATDSKWTFMFYVKLFTPAHGWPALHDKLTFSLRGLENVKVENSTGTGTAPALGTSTPKVWQASGYPSPDGSVFFGEPSNAAGVAPQWGGSADIRYATGSPSGTPAAPAVLFLDVTGVPAGNGDKIRLKTTSADALTLTVMDGTTEIQKINLNLQAGPSSAALGAPSGLDIATRMANMVSLTPEGAIDVNDFIVRCVAGHANDYRISARDKEVTFTASATNRADRAFRSARGKPFSASDSFSGLVAAPTSAATVYGPDATPDSPLDGTPAAAGAVTAIAATGDFDTGVGCAPDGSYINMIDQGFSYTTATPGPSDPNIPYFNNLQGVKSTLSVAGNYYAVPSVQTPTTFPLMSPYQVFPSAGMFGSLPSSGSNWRTLLFRPGRVADGGNHPSVSVSPPDHLLADLFFMPVVEPYPLTVNFATAGKVNLNYQIMPFTYIHRNTALRAVLRAEKLSFLQNANALTYKSDTTSGLSPNFRYNTDADWNQSELNGTLSQFEAKFTANKAFVSPTQICEIDILPAQAGGALPDTANFGSFPANVATLRTPAFLQTVTLTGENLKERTYANLMAKVTTKSNTYTVHYWVQSLSKGALTMKGAALAGPTEWMEGVDRVVGEQRGSALIERYIDPAAVSVNYATASGPAPLSDFYKWRILSHKLFTP